MGGQEKVHKHAMAILTPANGNDDSLAGMYGMQHCTAIFVNCCEPPLIETKYTPTVNQNTCLYSSDLLWIMFCSTVLLVLKIKCMTSQFNQFGTFVSTCGCKDCHFIELYDDHTLNTVEEQIILTTQCCRATFQCDKSWPLNQLEA